MDSYWVVKSEKSVPSLLPHDHLSLPNHQLSKFDNVKDSNTRCRARFRAGAFSVGPVSASNQPWGHDLRQQSLCT